MQPASPEQRFLTAIARVAATELGADHPLVCVAKNAAASDAPADAARVHEQLAGLDDSIRERLLAFAHREMREDIQAIWSLLPGAAQSGGQSGGMH